jgi:hypothetical protein
MSGFSEGTDQSQSEISYSPTCNPSDSNRFTGTNEISQSDKLIHTNYQSQTSPFTQTIENSESNKFSETSDNSQTNEISGTNADPASNVFSDTNYQSQSFVLTGTSDYSQSFIFSPTIVLSESTILTRTVDVSQSLSFSGSQFNIQYQTPHFSETNELTSEKEESRGVSHPQSIDKSNPKDSSVRKTSKFSSQVRLSSTRISDSENVVSLTSNRSRINLTVEVSREQSHLSVSFDGDFETRIDHGTRLKTSSTSDGSESDHLSGLEGGVVTDVDVTHGEGFRGEPESEKSSDTSWIVALMIGVTLALALMTRLFIDEARIHERNRRLQDISVSESDSDSDEWRFRPVRGSQSGGP